MASVELGLDVTGHLDAVDHEVGDEPVDLGVLHDDADQAGAGQVALAELGTGQVLLDESLHALTVGLGSDSER